MGGDGPRLRRIALDLAMGFGLLLAWGLVALGALASAVHWTGLLVQLLGLAGVGGVAALFVVGRPYVALRSVAPIIITALVVAGNCLTAGSV